MCLTDEELREIEQRAERATKGPWVAGNQVHITARTISPAGMHVYGIETNHKNGPWRSVFSYLQNDAEFIAHAREDIPRLIAEIRRLRKALEWIYEMQDLFYVEEIESDFGTIKKLPEHLVHISGPLQSLFLTVREALKGGN